ncbi:MAG: hypothetical protein K2Y16_15245, partial [Burkholderiales bacterium]|nr:hypothetical protein [Burkholderiales bacterium]
LCGLRKPPILNTYSAAEKRAFAGRLRSAATAPALYVSDAHGDIQMASTNKRRNRSTHGVL